MRAAETNLALPDLAIVGAWADSTVLKPEESEIQQLIWHLSLACTKKNGEPLLSNLINETYNLVGFGPMTSALRGLRLQPDD